MKYGQLGRSGIKVSRLCFGALTVGPLQAKLPIAQGAEIIRSALEQGVTFIDTADLYQTYEYIAPAIAGRDTVVASKSYDWTYDGMRASVEKACRMLRRDYIDIFMLHEQISALTLKGHREALEYLLDAKKAGTVRAVGVSTHTVEVVRTAALMAEIDVIHPIFNMAGLGIVDGTVDDMETAITLAAENGKGIYTMKALGGGHLIASAQIALKWVLNKPNINAVAVGMQTLDEVKFNIDAFSGAEPSTELSARISKKKRRVIVDDGCMGCGNCAAKCPMHAISIFDGVAVIDAGRCIICGYCGAHCPEFALKII